MAEVTSGKNLTVIVLTEWEASDLAGLLHRHAEDDHVDGFIHLYDLYDALVPTEERPARRCACGYVLDGYALDEDTCGACLDNPIDYVPVVARAEVGA